MNYEFKNGLKTIGIALGVSFFSIFVYSKFENGPKNMVVQTQKPIAKYANMAAVPAISTDFTEAAERSISAVVHVKVKVNVQNNLNSGNPFFDFFFGEGQMEPQPVEGSGSGVIISADGYIVTNNHVVEKSKNIEVVLNDKRSFKANVVGVDPTTDLALIKIDAKDLPILSFGNSDDLRVGEWVLAVGNPFNLSTTVTAGIVSAKARGIGIINSNQRSKLGIESFIQTDAAVNPGNSGGALVNTRGELVGINTAIASPTGAYAGYSFAVPVSIVKKVVGDIIEFGEVQRAVLGVQIADITSELAKEKDLKQLDGAYIAEVLEGGSAAQAGLKKGDIITSIENTDVKSVSELQEQISQFRPGAKINVIYVRDGKTKNVVVTLKNRLGNTEVVKKGSKSGLELLGAEFKPVGNDIKSRLGIGYGLQVTSLSEGKLQDAGVRPGYIIVKINDYKITSIDDLKKALQNIDGGLFISGIYPNGRTGYLAIDPEE